MRRGQLFAWGSAILLIVALIVFGLSGKGSNNQGKAAPALPRQRLAGPPVSLASLRGKPVIVTFWASWCGPCSHEAPALESFSKELAGRGQLVGVNWSDGISGARSFVSRNHWSFPNLRDSNGSVGLSYGLTGLPTTFVIDRLGRLRNTLRGPQTEKTLSHALEAVSRS
jgi:cytochrome c biogenesis protein CcmG, thiol:disulfide interchange protein DsbE